MTFHPQNSGDCPTDRQRQTDRQTIQQRDKKTHRQTDIQTDRQSASQSVRRTCRLSLPSHPVPVLLQLSSQLPDHAVDEVVEHQTARLGADRLPADGTVLPLFPPLADTGRAEGVRAVESDGLRVRRGRRGVRRWWWCCCMVQRRVVLQSTRGY